MQITSINIGNNFCAKFSPELANKVMACGKFLLRAGDAEGYKDLYEAAQDIKTYFPNGRITLKQTTRPEVIYNLHGYPIFKMPVSRYYICLERPAERDVRILDETIASSTFKLTPRQFLEIRKNLRAYQAGVFDNGYVEKEDNLLNKRVRELV